MGMGHLQRSEVVPVAIKRYITNNDASAFEDFYCEWRMLTELQHKNIIGVKGVAEIRGRHALVMELMEDSKNLFEVRMN